jgi:hypothetical protein
MPLTILEDAGEKPFHLTEWPYPEPFHRQTPYQHPKSIALPFVPMTLPLLTQHQWPNPTLAYARQTPFQIGKPIVLVPTEEAAGGGGSWDPHAAKKIRDSLRGIKRRDKPFEKEIDEQIEELVEDVIDVIEGIESPFAVPEKPKRLSLEAIRDISKAITPEVIVPGQEVAQLVRKQAVARASLLSNIRKSERLSKQKAVLQLENRINALVSKRRAFFIREEEDMKAIMIILGNLE